MLAAACAFALAALAGSASAGDDPPEVGILGDARVGETLTATAGDNFRWQRCTPAPLDCGDGVHDPGWSDVGVEGQGADSYTLVGADLGKMIRVLAKGAPLGTQFVPSDAVGPVEPASEPPPPSDPGVGPPTFDQSGNLDRVGGAVFVELPNGRRIAIHEVTQIPEGSIVDVSGGTGELVTQRKPNGPLQVIEIWDGSFVFKQKRKGAITLFKLTDSLGSHQRTVETAGHRGRRLWGRGKCRCRTRGRRSSGTARGTYWLTAEKRRGTLTKVREGKVLVKVRGSKKKVLVKAGQKYLARKR